MITLARPEDLDWSCLERVVYDAERLDLDAGLLAAIDAGHARFVELIERGTPCYGVTTGLGRLVSSELSVAERAELPANMLRARAAAIGEPFSRPVARAMLVFRLVNYLGGRAGVRAALCRFLVDRLNDGFTPWVPSLGHGMASDAIANTHAFQTFIGEGFVYGETGERVPAAEALQSLGIAAFEPAGREGLALVNGVCAAPALTLEAYRRLGQSLDFANLAAAISMDGIAVPRDSIDPALDEASREAGISEVAASLRRHLAGSTIVAARLQAPVSYRIVPQVHGACFDALAGLRARIDHCLSDFTDNPLLDGERLLSVGCFHNQHLVNQVEQAALALAHVGSLAERRLHRLLDAADTGLSTQLAARPGLDAGLVVTQKAAIDIAARLKLLAQPVSLYTGETSAGQEDYMALAVPALLRLFDMDELLRSLLAYELLAGIAALRQREASPGESGRAVLEFFADSIAPLDRDRAPGPDVETILESFADPAFAALTR
jgi:histidine ammonia-lyase